MSNPSSKIILGLGLVLVLSFIHPGVPLAQLNVSELLATENTPLEFSTDPLTILNLSPGSSAPHSPTITINGQTVVITWKNAADILLMRSIDGGFNFDPPIKLANGQVPSIAIEGQNVAALWKHEEKPGFFLSHLISFARSTDGGKTFGKPVSISKGVKKPFESSIALKGLTVIAAWDDKAGTGDIWYARSTNGGGSFSAPIRLLTENKKAFKPFVAMHGQTAAMAWTDSKSDTTNRQVTFARSTNGGATFSEPVTIRKGTVTRLSVDRQGITIVFNEKKGICKSACLIYSADGGKTFSKPVALFNQATLPSIAIHGKSIIAAWPSNSSERKMGNADIMLVHSPNRGNLFSEPINLSNSPRHSTTPAVATDGETVFVTWREDTPTGTKTPMRSEIFLTRIALPALAK